MLFRFQRKNYFTVVAALLIAFSSAKGSVPNGYASKNLPDPYLEPTKSVQLDTLPLKDRPGDFTNPNKRNPFDLKDPASIDKSIEYDIKTGRYLINERIGNEYYRTPSYMSFDEYLKWRAKSQEREYFDRLSGVSTAKSNKKDPLSKLSSNDPLKKIDLKNQLMDRLFGGSTVDIRTQGNIDVTLGGFYQKNENPTFPVRAQTQSGFDFDMAIRMNVTGKIGEKLNLSTNYNTQATFDFENQMKLNYDTKNFSEDAIVQKIEAGNVSLPLKGNLIQGAQSLFGLKTELQFGYLRLTGIASQQKSQRQNIKLQGGSQVQQFRLTADQYDENRHFFLSHINRELFEGAMKNLPQVNTQIKITRLEVWVTNDRNSTEEIRDIIALADLGEADPNKFTGTTFKPTVVPNYSLDICNKLGVPLSLPDNDANDIYKTLLESDSARQLQNVVNSLQRIPFLYNQNRDFEKIRARKLNLSEYSFNEDLGFISLNVNLRPNQVLGVAYEYTFNGVENHRVGEFSNDAPGNTDTLGVLFVKMLKSQVTNVSLPVWDLMMKNVYSTGAYQANREDFRLDIFYQDPRQGNIEKRFIPETGFEKSPLLNVFGLDKLNIQGDPQPDGVFDYVPGITINSKTGRIMFPVLEPFGSFLDSTKINKDTLNKYYRYQELYDSTITFAREFTEKNRFVVKGQYKSSSSSEISLGGINVPRGSVRVSAGSTELVEGRDYEVDYTIGKVRILNDAYISSSLPINVSYEDNTLFGFQTKTLIGARADYSLGKQLGIGDLNIGATYMHLFERPFTQKVNIGDDPINNRIYGMDLQYNADAPWITRLVDKLPLYSTKQPSNITVTGEAALLQPGHASAINQSKDDSNGAIYIDDFEGSTSSIDLRQPVNWVLSSVPKKSVDSLGAIRFRESSLINDLRSGVNRASISWYRIDQGEGGADNANPYTANIDPSELFRNTFFQPGQNIFNPFDIHYNPLVRGPYNFDIPEGHVLDTPKIQISAGLEANGLLKDPKSRWGGMMRAIQTTDFEQANVEFLEFWMLSPFIGAQNNNPGTLQIHLGNISEDVLPDSRTFFENALPTPLNSQLRTDTTKWGRIPRIPPVTIAFDNDTLARAMQDVGLDGFNNEGERKQYADYLAKVKLGVNANTYSAIEFDPSNDDFKFFRDESYRATNADAITRYSRNNFPEGNSKSSTGQDFVQAATNFPDIEDLNRDNSLNESENYYLYNIPLRPDGKEGIDTSGNSYITDTINYALNGQTITWYRFRIPIAGYKAKVGDIRDFRAIQFLRLVMTDFERPVTLRFARMELGRNQWRKYRRPFKEDKFSDGNCVTTLFDLNRVNVEENSGRQPFNYVIPSGITRENNIGGFFQNALQNEQALALRMEGLCAGKTQGIYKLLGIDLRLYDRLKMFVHAEGTKENDFKFKPGQLSTFIRLGSDLENNYYEYEIPMVASDPEEISKFSSIDDQYKKLVWLDSNTFDFKMTLLKDLKLRRNDKAVSLDTIYTEFDPDRPNAKIKVKGNPNLGQVKGVMIGFRNNDDMLRLDAEVWVNELRCTGLDERGGYAATGKVDIKIADLGTLNLSGSYASIGWGALDQRLVQRARESTKQYDIATNLELGKFLPEKWGIRLPFYAQYSNNVKKPEYDPYDLDVTLDEKLARSSAEDRDSIIDQSITRTQIRGYSFNNVRKDRVTRTAAAPKPWDVENFSLSYSNTQTIKQDPIVELDNLTIKKLQVDYGYSRNVKYLTPFKKMIKKDKYVKFISEINFNLLPNSFNASSLIERQLQQTTYRFAGEDPSANTYFNKRYNWLRNYSLNWDFTKALKFAFTAANVSVIDEVNEFNTDGSRASDATKKAAISEGLQKGGRTKNYTHNINLNYTVPLKNIPLMDWVNVRAQYAASYTWSAASLNTDTLGNVIQNTQNYQINGDLNFETLYNQWGYLRKINDGKSAVTPTRGKGARGTVPINEPAKANLTPEELKAAKKAKKEKKAKEKKEAYEPSLLEKIVFRPMMTIRKARLVYDEKFGSIVPGFKPQSSLLGQKDFNAPGWGYIAGMQPDDQWLTDAGKKEWITRSVYLNSPVVMNHVQSVSGTLNLEPFRDFKVDVDFKQDYTRNRTSYFKCDCDGNFSNNESTAREIGSYTISYMSIRTMFKDGNDNLVGLFKQFETNRTIISNRLAAPGAGFHEKDPGYREGYGKFQQDVLLPSFLAAYAGKDANTFRTNVFKTLPYPNWRLNYNGLAKLPFLKNISQNISITHSYKSTLTVSSFSSDLLFDPLTPTKLNPITSSYYARLAIPNVVVNEQFAPLIGVDLRLKNDMNLRFDYKKSRNLQMSFTDYQLAETKTSEIVIGFGYIVKNLRLPFLDFLTNLDPSAKVKSKKDKNAKNNTPQPTGGGNVPNNLNFKFDFSYRDDVTFNHILDQNIVQPTRGALTIRVSPSVDYTLNKSLNLRLFVDYNRTVPKTSAAPPNTSVRGGLTVRFTL